MILIVLAKAPETGRVKTRCCPPCTPEQAAGLGLASLLDTLDVAMASNADRVALVIDGPVGSWLRTGIEVIPQRTGSLGERIDGAFEDVAGTHPGAEPIFLVGMDTPQLTVGHLDRAASALLERDVDAVVGPATDGGFWGLGLQRPVPDLCRAVPMSLDTTGAALLGQLRDRAMSYRILDTLTDFDDFDTAVSIAAAGLGKSRFVRAVGDIEVTDRTKAIGQPV